ncbi:MAG: outer membrane protein assembly factor BamD [Flavobacteriaceae bacterium]|nr:MAG: outer membrane protein assembly factor BamD [Flavobacteriaceae bacterium]
MFLNMRQLLSILFLFVLLSSCNEYQKVLKNDDVKTKYEMAEKLYNDGDYKKASRLFEQIAPKYVGKPQGERVMFFYADSYFKKNDFYLSGYQFERFVKSYPKSDKAQEATFLGAKSYYELSPKYSLDQTDTDKALIKLQNFINAYPDSEYIVEANAMAKELTSKKEEKAFEIGKQFAKLGEFYTLDYNVSAIASLNNFISDYPGSIFKEDALFEIVRASTNLALNSTENRKQERLQEAQDAYSNLKKYFPETKYQKKTDAFLGKIEKQLQNYSK